MVDFCAPSIFVVVEIDGGQHAEDEERSRDAARTVYLTSNGYRVLRFWNDEVLRRTESVLEVVLEAMRNPLPNPLPERERGLEGTVLVGPIGNRKRSLLSAPRPGGGPGGERSAVGRERGETAPRKTKFGKVLHPTPPSPWRFPIPEVNVKN
ncbi:MAG: hypothetical protein QOD06_653 [Candidatus Binatota bacterium]|nr:hypothetical protein [Candidatus Binatota bacterium]